MHIKTTTRTILVIVEGGLWVVLQGKQVEHMFSGLQYKLLFTSHASMDGSAARVKPCGGFSICEHER